MTIRRATVADAPALAGIYVASEAAMRAVVGAGPLEAADFAAWFGDQLSAPDATVFVTPGLGYVAVGADELSALYVIPEAWGRGIAPALHDRALDELRARAVERVHLVVAAPNARARRFYERRGWRLEGPAESQELGGVEIAFVRYVRVAGVDR